MAQRQAHRSRCHALVVGILRDWMFSLVKVAGNSLSGRLVQHLSLDVIAIRLNRPSRFHSARFFDVRVCNPEHVPTYKPISEDSTHCLR